MIRYFRPAIASLLLSLLLIAPTNISGVLPNQTRLIPEDMSQDSPCVEYDSTQKLIEVRCKSIHLTDIYNQLSNPTILGIENKKEGSISSLNHGKVWILDAGIVVEKEASLIIDSSDTSWLKITSTPTLQLKKESGNVTDKEDGNASNFEEHTRIDTDIKNKNSSDTKGNDIIVVSKNNGDNPNGIHVHGSLNIDSVKITSWDPEKNDVIGFDFGKRPGEEHTKSDYDTAEPRAFIRVSKLATGTTNITNSELAYLGYSCSRCAGLSYYGGEGSILKNNNIHHLLKGFYSKGIGQMLIEDNKFHDNYLYGIDPHTRSHDIIIRNNKVYDNNASGIICSKDCYNLLIEGNEVYRNGGVGRGIAFSINTSHSIARNNDVHNNERCISFNRESNYNEVYNNTISNCDVGIYLSNTSKNFIYDNKIIHSKYGIVIKEDITNNITKNVVDMSKTGIVFINRNNTNLDDDNLNSYLEVLKSTNKLGDVTNPFVVDTGKIKGLRELLEQYG